MIFSDPNNRASGKLTIAERERFGATLEELGHDPKKPLNASDMMQALLLQAAQEHDQSHPGSGQEQAARNFCLNQDT